jgi:methylated-DNA-protein-cysteine methyltransferase-like protein
MRSKDSERKAEPMHGASANERSRFLGRVYAVVALIPPGHVTTYGRIARVVGNPRSARMVGWALHGAPKELNLPCQRVVNRNGELTGGWSFGHPDVMRALLAAEGIPFRDEYVVDLMACLWEPADDPAVEVALRDGYAGDSW